MLVDIDEMNICVVGDKLCNFGEICFNSCVFLNMLRIIWERCRVWVKVNWCFVRNNFFIKMKVNIIS